VPRSSYDDGWRGYIISSIRGITVAFSIDRAYNIYMSTVLTTLLIITLGLAAALWLLALLGR